MHCALKSLFILAAPPGDPKITAVHASTTNITVTWTTPQTNSSPSSYNVSISNGNGTININNNGSSVYTHVFMWLTSDRLYTVLLVAINCAGLSNGTRILSQTCKCLLAPHPLLFPATNTLSQSNTFHLFHFG